MFSKRLGIDLGTPIERLLARKVYVLASQGRVYGEKPRCGHAALRGAGR